MGPWWKPISGYSIRSTWKRLGIRGKAGLELINDDALLRIRYWDCGENQNNAIIVREDGTSQFPDFDFLEDDAATSNDEAVKQHNRDE